MIKCDCCNRQFESQVKLGNHLKYMREKETQKVYSLIHKEVKQRNSKKFFKENPEYLKKYNQENKEEITQRHKVYDIKNKFRKQEYMLKYHANNPDISPNYYKNNTEIIKDKVKKYQKTLEGNLICKAIHFKRRVILKTGQHSEITKETLKQLRLNNLKTHGIKTCELCFNRFKKGEQENIDHKIPISRHKEFPGVDLNTIENLCLAHESCNKQKYDLTLNEWFENTL